MTVTPSIADERMNRTHIIAIAILLIAVTLITYWPARGFDFLQFDDPGYLHDSPLVREGFNARTAGRAFVEVQQSNWHPLTTIVNLIERSAFGLENARGYHVVNIVIHALNAALLFNLLWMMTSAIARCGLVAALFALHPLHVESVAWISELKDVLSIFFMLLTMVAYVAYARGGRARWIWYGAMVVCYALALMSKPMVVTLPVLLLLIDAWPLRRPARWGLLGEKIPLIVMAAGSCAVTLWAQRSGGAMGSLESFPIATRIANALVAYATYLAKMVWPTRLAVFYPYEPHGLAWIGALAVLVIVTAIAILLRRRRPYLAVGWGWYLISLLPVIGIVQVGAQGMADRYTYLPLVGPFIAIVWAAAEMARGAKSRVVLAGLGLIVIGLLVARTRDQLSHWRNTRTLFTHAADVNPRNARAHFYLGNMARAERRFDDAVGHLRRAVELEPNAVEPWLQLGVALAAKGDLTQGEPILRRTIAMAEGEVAAQPNVARFRTRASVAHQNLGVALAEQKRFDAAAAEYEQALKFDPNNPVARTMLPPALLKSGQVDRAAVEALAVAAINPAAAALQHFEIAIGLRAAGKVEQAVTFYRRAIELNPKSNARNNLAWLLATYPDDRLRNGAEAVRLAESMKQDLGEHAEVLDTLAAAYAEAGDFDKAVATATAGVELARRKNQAALEKEIAGRLDIYRAGKPYRQQ
jgi:tetratricopeptide (TPR) repeat protein